MIRPAVLRFIALVCALSLCAALARAQLTFDPANPPASDTPPTEQYHHYTGAFSHQKGPKSVLVILVQPSDGATWTTPPAFATLDGQLNTASQNFYNASYHQTWFGPKRHSGLDIERLVVTPVLLLPKTTAEYKASFGTLQNDCLAAVRAQGGVWNGGNRDPNYFDRWVVMSNTKMISSTGLAYVGGRFSWTNGSLSGGVAEHELGHNLGVFHANDWTVPPGEHPRSSAGSNGEYQDGWDVMGGNNAGVSFNPQFRENLGFLERTRGEALDVTTSGVYRLYDYVHPRRRNDAGLVRALVIPMASFTDPKRVILGFGHHTGTDGGLSRSDWNRNAVTVHSKLSDGSNRIDTTPFSRATNDAHDSAIKIGRTYSESANVNGTQMHGGFHVTPVARGATDINGVAHEWIDVVVNYQNAIPSNNQPPAASFASSIFSDAAPATSYALAVTASDPDGDTLAYDWDFGDGSYSITNSPAQSKTWSAPGLYLASCTVSDLKGGTTTARAWVNVGNVPFRAPDSPAAVFPGLAYRYYHGSFNTLPAFDNLLAVQEGAVPEFTLSPRQQNDAFAFVFEGFLHVATADVYTFHLLAEDGARLLVGDTVVVANDGVKTTALETTGNIALSPGLHRIRVEYFHKDGAEVLDVAWSTLTSPRTSLPASALFRVDWADNAAPASEITAPASDASFVVGSDILLAANASDADGISRVQFFANGSFVGTATAAPYSVVWEKVSVGAKSVVAVATDLTGRSTVSAPVAFEVVSPPPTRSIGLNFGASDASRTVFFNEPAGAVYAERNWNNLPTSKAVDLPLHDALGQPTAARVTYESDGTRSGVLATLGTTDSGSGRLLRGGLQRDYDIEPSPNPNPVAAVTAVPFAQYDVYVYFDYDRSNAADTTAQRYVLTPENAAPLPARFGKNSLSAADSLGDYPSYDTWTGFREATALALDAPDAELLGNYVVFRNLTAPGFRVEATRNNGLTSGTTGRHRRYFNAVQIVEVPATIPQVRLTPPASGWAVTEGGGSVTYAVSLTVAPTSDVTVSVAPGAQLAAAPASFVFTPADWSQPRLVTLSAVDDAVAEGPHSGQLNHSVSASGNYAATTVAAVTVSIADNDLPTVSVFAHGRPAEAGSVSGTYRFTRADVATFAAPLTINFQLSGTAALSGDYTLSGASVSYSATTGLGSVVIPAGQAQVFLTLTPINDSVSEGDESAALTLVPGPAYAVGAGLATLTIIDDDRIHHFTQRFASGQLDSAFDLSNRKVTFTPDGSPGHYAASIAPATAFPSSTSGHTNLKNLTPTGGSLDDGFWTVTGLPVTFYGTAYTTFYVSTNGGVTFGSGDSTRDLTLDSHFRRKRVAGYWRDLHPGTSGNVYSGRVTTAGQERTVVTFQDVARFNVSGERVNFQIEFWDSGVITLTWLACHANATAPVVGLSNLTTGTPSGFLETDFSALAAPATNVNTAPQFASTAPTSVTVGQSYTYAIVATDAEGDALAFTASSLPAWLSLTDHGNGTATLAGTPPAAGTTTLHLHVSDGAASTTQTFALTVFPPSGNTAPVFTTTPPLFAVIEAPYHYAVAATDADGQALAFSLLDAPFWLSLTDHGDGTATLSGTPPAGSLPTATVTLLVSDSLTATDQSFTLNLREAPVITLQRPLDGAVELVTLDLDLHLVASVDPRAASATLAWSRVAGPGVATFSAPNAASTRVTFDQPGAYTLRLTADNGFAQGHRDLTVFAATSSSAARADSLQGHWRLDEEAAPFADASGNNRDASVTGTPFLGVEGYDGLAVNFTGANGQFLRVEYGQPTAFTAAAWVRADASPATGTRVVLAFLNNDTSRARLLLISGSRRLHFYSNHGTAGQWRIERDLPALEWTHVVLAYDRSSTANHPLAFINGEPVPVTRLVAPSGTNNTSNNFRIGCTTSSSTWLGRIDEVRLHDRLLSSQEVPWLLVPGPINQAPVVTAGPPADALAGQTITLDGAASDDGAPADPGALVLTWSHDSGPAGGKFGSPSSPDSTFSVGTVAGSQVLRLTADDGAARVSATVEVIVTAAASGYTTWQQTHFGTETDPAIIAPTADPDGDGVPNLLEYALGGDPLTPATEPHVRITNIGQQLQLSFLRARADLTYEVLASSDLVSWTVIATNPGDVGEEVTVTDPVSINPRRFLRLRVSQ